MGIVSMPTMEAHFKPEPFGGSSLVMNLFSWHRFSTILSMWHWEHTADLTEAQRNLRKKDDWFWSISGILKRLSDKKMRK